MDFVKKTLVENLGQPFHSLASGDQVFTLDQVPDLNGKDGVITGGSEGIGFGSTHTLLSKKISKLFILSKSEDKIDEALDAIEKELGPEARKAVVWKKCDLSDWQRTSDVAGEISKETDRIDILINNAARGIMTQQFAPTNGIDEHMATAHFGHVVLTAHLLPLLKKTADAGHIVRIVNLASNLHESAPEETAFKDIDELQKDYGPQKQYARSKLATLLHAKYLARHLTASHPNILANAVHPGIVDTAQTNVHIHEAYPLLGYGMSVGLKPFRKSQFDGCISSMYAATTCTESGLYSEFYRCRECFEREYADSFSVVAPPKITEKGSPKANDMELAEQLMKLTKEVIDQKTHAIQKGCPMNAAS
jgi:NAD(P)-dependent dehydrogenase (short-subunit alcohol dehydrogenase family)